MIRAGVSNTRPAGRMWPTKGANAARGFKQEELEILIFKGQKMFNYCQIVY